MFLFESGRPKFRHIVYLYSIESEGVSLLIHERDISYSRESLGFGCVLSVARI